MNSSAKPDTVTSKIEAKTKPTSKASPPARASKDAQECPIFLRKAYHMVDTCDPSIACWSEDGETFVVKNTDVFEKVIIPQFFKHSKFSSFVRQLNFYGFRKIKYADTIKIDAKLEAETANFWRFRHEKFQRGKPELLIEIKRSNGQQKQTAPKTSTTPQKPEEVGSLRSEVSTLKERIESMTKNIDALTTLVSKVTIRQEEQTPTELSPEVGSKRKKVEATNNEARPDQVSSMMELEDQLSFTPATMFPPPPQEARRESSGGSLSQISDDAFVDGLLTAFENDVDMGLLEEDTPPSTPPPGSTNTSTADDNKPDPKLMGKLSDALTLVPRDIQEMIVDRLVAAITSSDSLAKNVEAASALAYASSTSNVVENINAEHTPLPSQVSLPIAAAALAAMISHCSSNLKDGKAHMQKSLPIIPIH